MPLCGGDRPRGVTVSPHAPHVVGALGHSATCLAISARGIISAQYTQGTTKFGQTRACDATSHRRILVTRTSPSAFLAAAAAAAASSRGENEMCGAPLAFAFGVAGAAAEAD